MTVVKVNEICSVFTIGIYEIIALLVGRSFSSKVSILSHLQLSGKPNGYYSLEERIAMHRYNACQRCLCMLQSAIKKKISIQTGPFYLSARSFAGCRGLMKTGRPEGLDRIKDV